MAPGILPMPPNTAAVKALIPGQNHKKVNLLEHHAYKTPAPRSHSAITNVVTIIRSTLIPSAKTFPYLQRQIGLLFQYGTLYKE